MDRFLIEAAKPNDSEALLQLLEEGPYRGKISLLYTRRGNTFESFMREGQEVILLVCRDRIADRIAGP